jgi:ABC-2 type transport system permease protein
MSASIAAGGPRIALGNTGTMLHRSLRHGLRFPMMLITGLVTPVILLLMFVYIFGGALGSGAGGMPGGRTAYLDYIAPSMFLTTVCYGGGTTAVTVSVDLTEGIVDRFRTMPISQSAVLAGHVLGGVIRTLTAVGLIMAAAVGLGFRTGASAQQWAAAIGLLVLVTVGLTWLTIAFGAAAKNPAGANTAVLPLQILPLISSAFVATSTMPAPVRIFAECQPFTPIIDTLRGLLVGGPIGHDAWIAVAWCVAAALTGFAWSRRSFRKRT